VLLRSDESTLLRLVAHVVVARANQVELEAERSVTPTKYSGVVVSEWPLKDDSWVHNIFEGKRFILVNYPPDPQYGDPGAWLTTGSRDPEAIYKYARQAGRTIGLARTIAATELADAPGADPIATDSAARLDE
jgi:hypothetical protein